MNKNAEQLISDVEKVNINLANLIVQQISLLKDVGNCATAMEELYIIREKFIAEIRNSNPSINIPLAESVFDTIVNLSIASTDEKSNKELLISSKGQYHFESIKDIFKLSTNDPIVVAGPCAIEKLELVEATASFLKKQGIKFIRGGAYKPRTSPYEFQGLKLEGLKILKEVGKKYNLITITEVVDTRDVEKVAQHVDVLQIGARNMHNFELLKEVGASGKAVLLIIATILLSKVKRINRCKMRIILKSTLYNNFNHLLTNTF